MLCKNCGHSFEGNFCSHCGQSATVGRLDFKFLMHELPNSIFQFNRGLFYTFKELTVCPGHSIRNFLHGKRKPFYKPIAYFLVTSALYVLIAHLAGRNTFVADLISGVVIGMGASEKSSGSEIINWILKNQTYITLLFIPIYALASYLAFKNYKYNYVEHLVLNLYITGQQMLIYLLLGLVIITDNMLMLVPVLLAISYNIWTYSQFFDKKKRLSKGLQILLSYMLVFAQIFIIIFVASAILKLFR